MKRMIASVLSVLTVTAACAAAVSAEEAASVNVYVTIADAQGAIALAAESVAVSDADGDGALTINDALYHAHEIYYDGGAAAGYASAESEYGLSLNKLWGTENGGSYGYYQNNASAWSLTDVIAEGDYINAFVFTDLNAWSDTYCYFDVNTASAEAGEEITLTLSAAGYDANWNPAVLPVEGAVITIDGEATDFITDAQGMVTFTLEEGGSFVISAVSETQTLVPPVCKATIEGSTSPATEPAIEPETESETAPATDAETQAPTEVPSSTTTTASGTQQTTSPSTGDASGIAAVVAVAGCAGVLALTRKRNDAE